MKKELALRKWSDWFSDFGVSASLKTVGSFSWIFPDSSFELESDCLLYGEIHSFEDSISYDGMVPINDFIVIGISQSGALLIMKCGGDEIYQCYWLGVGFECHKFDKFDDLIDKSVGYPWDVLDDILKSGGGYFPLCHERFNDYDDENYDL